MKTFDFILDSWMENSIFICTQKKKGLGPSKVALKKKGAFWPLLKTSLVAGLLEAQAGCRVEGGVLRVRVRRREGRPGGRGSWVGQAMDSPGVGGGLALGMR